jgi:hypothetical protein
MRYGIEYEDYCTRLLSQLDQGETAAVESDACALAEAVLHAMSQLEAHKRADTLSPDTAGDLLDDLRHIVAGVL